MTTDLSLFLPILGVLVTSLANMILQCSRTMQKSKCGICGSSLKIEHQQPNDNNNEEIKTLLTTLIELQNKQTTKKKRELKKTNTNNEQD